MARPPIDAPAAPAPLGGRAESRMHAVALVLSAVAVIAALISAPGQYLAIGFGIAAVGTGRIAYARTSAPGLARIAGAGAMTVGALGVLLGAARVIITLAALGRLESMIN